MPAARKRTRQKCITRDVLAAKKEDMLVVAGLDDYFEHAAFSPALFPRGSRGARFDLNQKFRIVCSCHKLMRIE